MVSLQLPAIVRDGRKSLQAFLSGLRRHASDLAGSGSSLPSTLSVLSALALVGAMTLCLIAVKQFVNLHHVSSAYLIPVLIAATRLGMVPALVAAIGGVGASAFFFYPPILDFRVHNPEQLLDLPLFVIVAAVTAQLTARAHAHAVLAHQREGEMRALYAFSRRLAVATDPAQIYSAIEDHVRAITGCRVVYFEAGARRASAERQEEAVPPNVLLAVSEFLQASQAPAGSSVADERTGSRWLIRAVSRTNSAFGVVAIDVGRHGHSSMPDRADAVLSDAAATLERLDVARAIGEVKVRAEAETLRAALMGSVTHGLRTPLASIMGSASILVQAPTIMREPRLADLAGIVRDEAERLNSDIQRLLDATRISSAGVRPNMAWVDTAEIVNAALSSQRRRLSSHRIAVTLPDDLPLVNADQVLIEQALCQLLDNAAKYSPAGSVVHIEARSDGGWTAIEIRDEGIGLAHDELDQIFERLYRGPRTLDATSGSGLGLWVARALIVACGGRIEAASEGVGRGTVVSITLQEAAMPVTGTPGGPDD